MTLVDWVDLPNDNYIAILGYETLHTIELHSLIQEYNLIPKDQSTALSCRIKQLNKIIAFIDDWIKHHLFSFDKVKHLNWISEIAFKKRNYLLSLQSMYDQNRHEEAAQTHYHTDKTGLKDPNKQIVVLTNHRFFSLKMKEYWGDFWYETLDPCHRRLTPFLDQWRSAKRSNPSLPHFFLWLENQHLPKYVPQIAYLTEVDLQNKRLIIKDGLFWENFDHEWMPANFDPLKRYLFSINLKEEIYVAEEGNGISHSSFTCGKPVLGAGLMQIKKGLLISLALESGHYMPSTEVGFQILNLFKEQGAHFPSCLEVVFFFDRNKYRAEISLEDLSHIDKFKCALDSVIKKNYKNNSCTYENTR